VTLAVGRAAGDRRVHGRRAVAGAAGPAVTAPGRRAAFPALGAGDVGRASGSVGRPGARGGLARHGGGGDGRAGLAAPADAAAVAWATGGPGDHGVGWAVAPDQSLALLASGGDSNDGQLLVVDPRPCAGWGRSGWGVVGVAVRLQLGRAVTGGAGRLGPHRRRANACPPTEGTAHNTQTIFFVGLTVPAPSGMRHRGTLLMWERLSR
jgi:hypothetical protein